MERINAVTFAPFCARGTFEKEETRQSLKLMKEKTGANYVIFAPNGVQKTAFSETIDRDRYFRGHLQNLSWFSGTRRNLARRCSRKPATASSSRSS